MALRPSRRRKGASGYALAARYPSLLVYLTSSKHAAQETRPRSACGFHRLTQMVRTSSGCDRLLQSCAPWNPTEVTTARSGPVIGRHPLNALSTVTRVTLMQRYVPFWAARVSS